MSWLGRALGSVTQYYKEINPSTLSGAIDVVVVEQRIPSASLDGTYDTYSSETQLVCTPFHVRFGKLSVLRPTDRRVVVRVNSKEVPLAMKVGETGEAFFVFETDQDAEVPEDMMTSPLAGPVRERSQSEPEPLDLGDAAPLGGPVASDSRKEETSTTSNSSSSKRKEEADTKPYETPGKDLGDPSKGGTALAQSAASRVTQIGSLAAAQAADATGNVLHTSGSKSKKQKGQDEEDAAANVDKAEPSQARKQPHSQVNREVKQLERSMAHQLELDAERQQTPEPAPVDDAEWGSDARSAAKHEEAQFPAQEMHRLDIANSAPFPSTSSPDTESGPSSGSPLSASYPKRPPRLSNSHQSTRNLMLDMDGYKVGSDDQDRAKTIENHLISGELAGEHLGEDVVLFTQSLLRSADLEKSRHGAEALEQYSSKVPAFHQRTKSEASPPSRASSPTPSMADLTVSPVTSSNTTFSVTADGNSHNFELALCPQSLRREESDKVRQTEFDQNRITIEELRNNASLVNDTYLVCRFQGKYLTWENASPVLASLGIYQDTIANVPFPASSGAATETPPVSSTPGSAPDTPPTSSSGGSRRWSSWWSGTGSSSTTKPKTEPAAQPEARARSATTTTAPSARRASRAASPEPFQGSVNDRSVRATSPEPEPMDRHAADYDSDLEPSSSAKPSGESSPSPEAESSKRYAKTLRLTSDQLKQLNLKKGRNDVSFSVMSSYSSNVVKCTSRIFLWDQDYKVVISDIDGTITKSDALGHAFAMIGRDWTHHGVAKLYTDIARNGYKLLYLTSRAIGQADTTREYLRGINQSGYVLPEGPVIMSPDRLMTSLHREVIARKPEVFKMACLQDVQNVFSAKPFYAGFGNRITDALSYRTVDIPSARIFTIDSYGDVKMELLELAGYRSSYIAMTDLVDQMFPPVNREASPEFSDFNYWRQELPKVELPDLSPPSPPASVRSESSRYSLRRITSSITRRPPEASSLARQTKVSGSKPTSPLSTASVVEEEPDELQLDAKGKDAPQAPQRRQRSNSMPGSFEDDHGVWPRKEDDKNSIDDGESLRRKAVAQQSDDEANSELAEDDDGFPMDDMDFSSVPY